MKIKFTHDFQGTLTNEAWYLKDTEIEIEDEIAAELITLHHAVEVAPPQAPAPKPKPRKAPKPPVAQGVNDGD